MARNQKLTDGEILNILDLRDKGFANGPISRQVGVSRGVISGILHRIGHSVLPDPKHDGTLPYRWWDSGLSKRSQRAA